MKKIEEILENNKKVIEEMETTQKEIDELIVKLESLKTKLTAPCEHCPYDGQYRCEACAENNFEGYNIKNYL